MQPETDQGDEALRGALRAAQRSHLRSVRFSGGAGSAAAAAVLLALVWSHLPHGRLLVWFSLVVGLSVAMVVAASVERSARWAADDGTPKLSIASHVATGALWGGVLWIDPAASTDRVTTMTILAVLFAMSAGAMGGTQPSAVLSTSVVSPMWLLAATRLLLSGEVTLAVGSFVFLGLVLADLRAGSDLFRNAVRFRLMSEARAHRAHEEARLDALTRLPNRSGLEEHVAAMLATDPEAVTVLFVDLDNFKDINDRFGHHSGDRVLCAVADRLRARTDATSVVARFGGDEFFIAVPAHLTPPDVDSMAARLIAAIEEPIAVDQASPNGLPQVAMVSASIGTSSVPAAAFDMERAYLEADHALYEAKRQGRRRSRSFVTSGRSPTTGVASRLREALASGAIDWWAQPVFDIDTGDIEAAELLARWTLDDGSSISPAVFVAVADTSGLIGDLSRQTMRFAADTMRRWRDHPALRGAAISLNLSPHYLADGTLIDDLVVAFDPIDLAQGRYWLEITESHDLTGVTDVEKSLGAASRLGALLAVDDFGTGYTSVRQLHDLPVSIVKLDRWLSEDLDTRSSRRLDLARAVQSVAMSLGHRTVAEGVERVSQIQPIRDMGIDLVQGYLLAGPMPLDQLERSADDLRASALAHLESRSRQG